MTKTIRSSLDNLRKAIDGIVAMTNELDEVFNKLYDNKVPEVWNKVAYPSLKPLASWINDFLDRYLSSRPARLFHCYYTIGWTSCKSG